MKSIRKINENLCISLFVCGVAFYLIFAAVLPLIHNHQMDGKHHHSCFSCKFKVTASSMKIEIGTDPYIFFHVVYKILPYDDESCKLLFCKKYSIRAPPNI